jgi:hypothetical protein
MEVVPDYPEIRKRRNTRIRFKYQCFRKGSRRREMDRMIHSLLIVLAMSSLFSNSTMAGDDPARNWQLSLLFNPGEQQYKMENRGRVFIYDGLRDTEVERALDEQYDRVESMMFVNTVITDEDGEPLRDEDTGEMLVENDGCD